MVADSTEDAGTATGTAEGTAETGNNAPRQADGNGASGQATAAAGNAARANGTSEEAASSGGAASPPPGARAPTGAAAAPPQTVAAALGEIVWLFAQSANHRHLFIADLEWMVMPPILLRQFRIFRANERPAGVAFWAHASDEVQARIEAGVGKLKPDDWKSGEHTWLVDVIAPFGKSEEMLADLRANVFKGQSFKLHRMGPDGKRHVEVMRG